MRSASTYAPRKKNNYSLIVVCQELAQSPYTVTVSDESWTRTLHLTGRAFWPIGHRATLVAYSSIKILLANSSNTGHYNYWWYCKLQKIVLSILCLLVSSFTCIVFSVIARFNKRRVWIAKQVNLKWQWPCRRSIGLSNVDNFSRTLISCLIIELEVVQL